MKHLGDITKINGAEIEPVHCIVGGSPCQDLSVAGKRKGMRHAELGDDETTRSGLFMEQIRITKEMRENAHRIDGADKLVRYPRYLVWENVIGAFSSNFEDGFGDFGAVLEEVIRVAEPAYTLPRLPKKQKWTKSGAIAGDGWSVAWRSHNAEFFGVPQRRRRICLVADYDGYTAGDIVFECLRSTDTSDRAPSVSDTGAKCGQQVLSVGGGLQWHLDKGKSARKETAGDTAAGSGRHDSLAEPVGTDIYNLSETGDISASLTANTGTSSTHAGPTVAEPILLESNQNHATVQTDGISTALPASMGMGGGYVPMVTETYQKVTGPLMASGYQKNGTQEAMSDMYVTVALEGNGQRESHRGDGYKESDTMYTLNTTEVHGVAYGINGQGGSDYQVSEDVANTMTAASNSSGNNKMAVAYAVDCRNAAVDSDKTGAMQATACHNLNSNNVVAYTLKVRGGVETDSNGRKAGKGALIQEDMSATIGVSQDQTLFQPITLETFHCQLEEDKAPILKARDYKDPPCVCYGISSFDSNSMKSSNPTSGIYETETSRTLDLNGGSPACNQGGIAVCEPTMIEMTSTKNTVIEDGISPTLTARMGTGGNQVNAVCQHVIRWIVRRLTPLECERLQGFQDGWTDIGEWYDRNGKRHKPSDAPRYKALGNSIAIPFWAWMFRNMARHLPERATLGSLFDGIGGFPLAWESIHGKGTARWASEIEEFPIAVTKKHFGEE